MGEYDTSTTSDGRHEDVPIADFVTGDFVPNAVRNDIAIVYLKYDVKFTGEFVMNFFFFIVITTNLDYQDSIRCDNNVIIFFPFITLK